MQRKPAAKLNATGQPVTGIDLTPRPPGQVPSIPPNMPQVRPNRFIRWCARKILQLSGWKIAGELPNTAKLVMIVAPHSSNWDGVWGMVFKVAVGLDVKVLGKASLFWWPLKLLLHKLGVVPVDRSNAGGVVQQAADAINAAEKFWFAITPEGTRKRVDTWKMGFWKIAHTAKTPIFLAYFHYPEKVMGLGPLFYPTDDMEADMAAIRAWYKPWMGKTRGTE